MVVFLSDCYCGVLTTRMEGIGKRYTFLMGVLGKVFFFFCFVFLRKRANQQEHFFTGDSNRKEIFSDGREQKIRYIFLTKERQNLL